MTWSRSTQASLFALMGHYALVSVGMGSFSHSSVICMQTPHHYSGNCGIIFTELLITESLYFLGFWLKHILLVNTKGLGVAKLRRKPNWVFNQKPDGLHVCHKTKDYNSEHLPQIWCIHTYTNKFVK